MSTESARDLQCSLKLDNWLTERLGRAAWRVEKNSLGEQMTRLQTTEALFAYAKIAAGDVATLWRLSDAGFRVVDMAVTLEGTVAIMKVGENVRFAKTIDRDAVVRVAGCAFRYSRFHLDPSIETETANAIKAEWAANYFRDERGDGMVVAEHQGQVVGFLQLLWQPDDCLLIDLIGVDPPHQGRGIGADMIRFASVQGTGDHRRPARIRVGTQAANTSSIRLYESLGFRLIDAQYVLHYHSKNAVA